MEENLEQKLTPIFNVNYMKEIYTENHYEKILNKIKNKTKYNFSFFKFENKNFKKVQNLELTHWSSFENWDPYRNYVIAKKYCNLIRIFLK